MKILIIQLVKIKERVIRIEKKYIQKFTHLNNTDTDRVIIYFSKANIYSAIESKQNTADYNDTSLTISTLFTFCICLSIHFPIFDKMQLFNHLQYFL